MTPTGWDDFLFDGVRGVFASERQRTRFEGVLGGGWTIVGESEAQRDKRVRYFKSHGSHADNILCSLHVLTQQEE